MTRPTGTTHTVRRLSDGAIVPLTCTEEQLKIHLANGYELVSDEETSADADTTPKRTAKRAS